MAHPAERLGVDLTAFRSPVESAGHEVTATALMMQAAVCHLNASGARHQVIGVFDASESFRIRQFSLLTVGNPVELQQPVFEAGLGVDLSRSKLAGFGMPREHRLRTGAAGRCTDAQDLFEGLLVAVRTEAACKSLALDERPTGKVNQCFEVDSGAFSITGQGRFEFQRADPAATDVAESVHRTEVLAAPAGIGQPYVNEVVSVAIGQRVREQSRQPTERVSIQGRKGVRSRAHGHGQRGDFYVPQMEVGVVLKDTDRSGLVPGYRPNPAPPQVYSGVAHRPSPQKPSFGWRWRSAGFFGRARCRSVPRRDSTRSIGRISCEGIAVSR